jgi:hypothetical protein
MKRLLTSLLLFLVLFKVSDYGIEQFILKYNSDHSSQTIRMLYNQDSALDVLFFGSSHFYSGIDPKYFDTKDLSTYNFSLATAGPIYYRYMLDAFLENNPAPKLVAIETSYFLLTTKSDNLKYGYFKHLDLKNRYKYYAEQGDIKNGVTTLVSSFALRDRLRGAIKNFVHQKGEKVQWDRGFIKTTGELSNDLELHLAKYDDYFTGAVIFHPNKLKHLEHCLNILKERNIPFILLDPPEYHLLSQGKQYQPNREAYLAAIHELTSQFGGKFLDFNQDSFNSIRKNPALFRNADHLNSTGAQVFSELVYSRLKHEKYFDLN